MALFHFSAKVLSRSTQNTVGAVAYRAGCQLYDMRTGETFDYQNKDVQHVELLVPKDAPQWIKDIQNLIKENRPKGVQVLSEKVEASETRINSQVWREIEVALHRELTEEQNIALAREFVEDQLCGHGMATLLNFHFDKDEETGDLKPHCHVLLTMRTLEEKGFNSKKERSWNAKALMCELREQWAHYSNFHLKLHGHEVQIDHRSYYERGIEIEPQPKRGKSVTEQDKRIKGQGLGTSFYTDKQKEFEAVKLRNLYRILKRPEVALEIVTKHHTTFMWADVQKVLHRYIDDLPLFQKMEARLKNSNELVILHSGEENGSNRAIYSTRSLLKIEASLIEMADTLGRSKIHGVEKNHAERTMIKAYKRLGIVGGLSLEQERAVRHLVGSGQLNCLVGIAGSGKTTLLKVCHEIWESQDYRVYGLAPTGKATQNLEQSGIRSTTIHKFLKDYESGRCQYNSQSVLVLDEAGMVDMEKFSQLLKATQELGVKLVVVGDGAQLQPVEAGPAFRLITERVGKQTLSTVMRQKEDWQKKATVLFGQQRTSEAVKRYQDKGHIHTSEEKLSSLHEVIQNRDWQSLVRLYEVSSRVSSLIYREMAQDVEKSPTPCLIRDHQDYKRYLKWKEIEKKSAQHILKGNKDCNPVLESKRIDPTKMALLFVDKTQDLSIQRHKTKDILKSYNLASLAGITRPKETGQDVRQEAREALLNAWHASYQNTPEKTSLMLAFSNRDVDLLNEQARFLLKASNHLDKQEFLYTIKKEREDDFGKKHILKAKKGFSKGDRIVFTRNNYGLGVKNGTMGTITALSSHKIQVKIDQDQEKGGAALRGKVTTKEEAKGAMQEISFSPNLYPYFDHGWAVTIHKSQGTTVDKTYLLASSEMNQNLTYVAMTRHREDVQVFGSSLDFWREEKFPEILSKSGEKLAAADYLDAHSLEELMRKEDKLLSKIFTRISDELEAMGAVSKKVFWTIADYFLGKDKTPEIKMPSQDRSLREGIRAEHLQKELSSREQKSSQHSIRMKASPRGGARLTSFNELKAFCEARLYKIVEKEGNPLTNERKQRFSQQAERTATYLLHSHILKGRTPTEKEISQVSLRAKYELNRIPQIREEIIKGWKANNNFKESERILAHSIAERRAIIEGRLFLEAKQQGLKPPSDIEALARLKIKKHREKTDSLAGTLMQSHSFVENPLSKEVALQCAKDIFRHIERHGNELSQTQISNMIQIAKVLENRDYPHAYQSTNSHEIDFFRRHEGDSLFHNLSHLGNLCEFEKEASAFLKYIDKVSLPQDIYYSQGFYAHSNGLLKEHEHIISPEVEDIHHDKGVSL